MLRRPKRPKKGATPKKGVKSKKGTTPKKPAEPTSLKNLETHSLRPGLLVYCTVRVQGGVHYSHEELQEERDGESETKVFKTTKHTENVDERKEAEKLRTKLRGTVARACWPSMFGLFCPLEDKEEKGPTALRAAVIEAMNLVLEFNGKSETCRLLFTVIPAKVETSDAVAMAGIAAEMRATCEEMKAELSLGRPDAARKLANRMRDLGRMLDAQSAEVADEAIKAVRKAASAIVKDGANTASKAADILKGINLDPIDSARVAFLDLESRCAEEVRSEVPAVDIQRVANLDLDVDDDSTPLPDIPNQQPELSLE